MPWRHVDAKSERLQFVRDARQRLVTFTELCALYHISRVSLPRFDGRVSDRTYAASDNCASYPAGLR
jgi:hypothetical protein